MMGKNRTALVLIAGTAVLGLAIGIRLTFGLFLQPITLAHGWGRETFAFAIALQNIFWGAFQPFMGMVADRWGSGRVIALGGIIYGVGLYLMSQAGSPAMLNLTAGLLIGMGLSGTSFAVVLGAVGRAVSEERRSMALGIAAAGGSIGQFAMLPIGQALISSLGWMTALAGLGLFAALMVPLSLALAGKPTIGQSAADSQPLGAALREAAGHRGFLLLVAGFFVCGFQVTFIGTHLPAFVVDQGLSPGLGAVALSLIGFCNILGTYFWGFMGGRHSKKNALSLLYLSRSGVIALLMVFPISELSILIFSGAIGFLWLGTVPLTSGLVGQIFGVQYVSTLFGIVFFSHQIGAFLGVWLGGYFYDLTGSYLPVWYAGIALGVASALLHQPIREEPIIRPSPAAGQ